MRAQFYSSNRRSSPCSRTWLAYTGCLAIATVLSLALLLYCFPPKHLQRETTASAVRQTNSDKGSKVIADLMQQAPSSENLEEDEDQADLVARIVNADIDAGGLQLQRQAATGFREPRPRGPGMYNKLLPGQCGGGQCRNGTSHVEDFVFAVATHEYNEPTLKAGRAGRLGMRTYISTNYTPTEGHSYPATESETWGYYPDDKPLRSFYEGDTRAALVPFLALRDLGDTFKWVFYGDDDTIFFVDAAMRLVKDLDPEMPYFLTDHFWYANWRYGYPRHPHWRAPRCLPCFSDLDTSILRMDMVKACPCTPWDMCNLAGGYDEVLDNRTCTPPRAPTLTYSMHGGAGALISIGLLKKISFRQIELCALQEWNTGGDSFITTCLWQAGYGMTDPGPTWHPEGLTRFDPSPRKLVIDHTTFVIPRSSYIIGNLIAKSADVCGPTCQLEMDHVISLHMRARLLTNTSSGAGVLLRGVARFYNMYTGRITAGQEQELQDAEDAAAAAVAAGVDREFASAVRKLKLLAPSLTEVAKKQVKWPMEKVAQLFLPTKASRSKDEEIELTAEDFVKGAASGIAQTVLEVALQEALRLYPPP